MTIDEKIKALQKKKELVDKKAAAKKKIEDGKKELAALRAKK